MGANVFRTPEQAAMLAADSTSAPNHDHEREDRRRCSQDSGGIASNAAQGSQKYEDWPDTAEAGRSPKTASEQDAKRAAEVIARLCEVGDVKIKLPNGADLRNITGFIKNIDPNDPTTFDFTMHDRWVFVHPAVLALTACAAELVNVSGGTFVGEIPNIRSLAYLVRMKLFDYVRLQPPIEIFAHEEAGRFIPLTQIKTADDLRNAIANLVPLLHAEKEVADPIKYVFSEMVRNALEHSGSPVGAFVAAQYYKESKRIAIGIADAGVGVYEHMRRFHKVNDSKEAMLLALQPGITGTTGRVGGTARNAGAGLFFTKSIASFSRNMFMMYSGDAAYRLMRGPDNRVVKLQANPALDPHLFPTGLPNWNGTVVGIDITVSPEFEFSELLNQVRKAYYLDVKRKKDFAPRIKFT